MLILACCLLNCFRFVFSAGVNVMVNDKFLLGLYCVMARGQFKLFSNHSIIVQSGELRG